MGGPNSRWPRDWDWVAALAAITEHAQQVNRSMQLRSQKYFVQLIACKREQDLLAGVREKSKILAAGTAAERSPRAGEATAAFSRRNAVPLGGPDAKGLLPLVERSRFGAVDEPRLAPPSKNSRQGAHWLARSSN